MRCVELRKTNSAAWNVRPKAALSLFLIVLSPRKGNVMYAFNLWTLTTFREGGAGDLYLSMKSRGYPAFINTVDKKFVSFSVVSGVQILLAL